MPLTQHVIAGVDGAYARALWLLQDASGVEPSGRLALFLDAGLHLRDMGVEEVLERLFGEHEIPPVTCVFVHPPSGMFQRLSQIEGVQAAAREIASLGGTVRLSTHRGGHETAPRKAGLPAALRGLTLEPHGKP